MGFNSGFKGLNNKRDLINDVIIFQIKIQIGIYYFYTNNWLIH